MKLWCNMALPFPGIILVQNRLPNILNEIKIEITVR